MWYDSFLRLHDIANLQVQPSIQRILILIERLQDNNDIDGDTVIAISFLSVTMTIQMLLLSLFPILATGHEYIQDRDVIEDRLRLQWSFDDGILFFGISAKAVQAAGLVFPKKDGSVEGFLAGLVDEVYTTQLILDNLGKEINIEI